MNNSKTKVKMETDTIYMSLGHRYSTTDKKQDKEIQRRNAAGWTTFAKHCDIFMGNIERHKSTNHMYFQQ